MVVPLCVPGSDGEVRELWSPRKGHGQLWWPRLPGRLQQDFTGVFRVVLLACLGLPVLLLGGRILYQCGRSTGGVWVGLLKEGHAPQEARPGSVEKQAPGGSQARGKGPEGERSKEGRSASTLKTPPALSWELSLVLVFLAELVWWTAPFQLFGQV